MPTVLDTVGLFWAVWGGERRGTGVGVIGCGPVCGLGARLGGAGNGDSGTTSSSEHRGSDGTGGGGLRGKELLEGARAARVDGRSAAASICRVAARCGSCSGARAHDECREGVFTLTFIRTLLVRVAQNLKNVEV